jgi:hypothetical protein
VTGCITTTLSYMMVYSSLNCQNKINCPMKITLSSCRCHRSSCLPRGVRRTWQSRVPPTLRLIHRLQTRVSTPRRCTSPPRRQCSSTSTSCCASVDVLQRLTSHLPALLLQHRPQVLVGEISLIASEAVLSCSCIQNQPIL